jgi:hypothetical protein
MAPTAAHTVFSNLVDSVVAHEGWLFDFVIDTTRPNVLTKNDMRVPMGAVSPNFRRMVPHVIAVLVLRRIRDMNTALREGMVDRRSTWVRTGVLLGVHACRYAITVRIRGRATPEEGLAGFGAEAFRHLVVDAYSVGGVFELVLACLKLDLIRPLVEGWRGDDRSQKKGEDNNKEFWGEHSGFRESSMISMFSVGQI